MEIYFLSSEFSYHNLMNDSKLLFLPPAMNVSKKLCPKVISSTSRGRCDYFSPYFADHSFITASIEGKQGRMVTDLHRERE